MEISKKETIERMKSEIESTIKDPRRTEYGNIKHKLTDIVVIALLTIICGGEDFDDMEEFGREREDFLRDFLELSNGIPDKDTFRRLFERIKPESLSECLFNWLDQECPERAVIAVDGKTIRGSSNEKHKAYHVVSAFVADNQITLGEIAVDEKSNEITAVPKLLEMFYIDNAIITADAMSCQKEIVKTISEEKADYVIALKNNQPNLYRTVSNYFEVHANELEFIETLDNNKHGRTELRKYCLIKDLSWLDQRSEWEGLAAVGMVISETTSGGQTTIFIRYFITSLTDINEFSNAVRKHWAIENNLHWSLDVIFREDASLAKKEHSPLNLNILRKQALSLLSKAQPHYHRLSKNKLRFKAALNTDILLDILSSFDEK